MIQYDDMLAEYFSPDDHKTHAEVLKLAVDFHIARAAAKTARINGDDAEGDRHDLCAAHFARVVEQIMEDR